ncbi:unnamed protein product [Durusdinium trenchii]|uniref:Uncharacterized protein n=1 Tax=Durusdinium trenchii TaxID=1381693 RepID=A0ABP0KBG8_9DINO
MKSSLIGDLQKEAGRVSLIAGQGGDGDNLHEKTVYVYDTTEFPAHLAEEYLQFQDDMSRIYNKVKAELTLAESGSLCPGAELYIPWANIGIFVAVTAAVVFLARIGCKLDWPGGWGRRQISSMKSGRASLIEADVEESYQGLNGPSIEDSQLVNRS